MDDLKRLIAEYQAVTGKTVTYETEITEGPCANTSSATITLNGVRMPAEVAKVRMTGVVRRSKGNA